MTETTLPRPAGALARAKRFRSPWTVSAILLLAVAILDPGRFSTIGTDAARAFAGTVPFILVAVTLVAYLKASGAETMIGRAFEGREASAIVLAALFGGLAPFCSCEVIPFVAGLIALGAPIAAIMAFWLASPLIDPGSLLITAAALDWPFAIGKAMAAVGLGLFGGFVTMAIARMGLLTGVAKPRPRQGCGCGANPATGRPHWAIWTAPERRDVFRAEGWDNLVFLVKWLILAYVLEALLITYMPAHWIASVVGGEGTGPIVLSALVGMPAYLNSYVAPALLAGLMEQGMSAGAAMAFMVAGAVSSIPAMAAIWALVKPHVFALYLGLGLTGAVIAGMIYQAVI
ncbi:MAG: permease [Maritimibacter harenae]